jgi:hypothetical protein
MRKIYVVRQREEALDEPQAQTTICTGDQNTGRRHDE